MLRVANGHVVRWWDCWTVGLNPGVPIFFKDLSTLRIKW